MADTNDTFMPGLNIRLPPQPGVRVPTPMGWMPSGMATSVLANLMPSRNDIADVLGAPVDMASWVLRKVAGVPIPGSRQEVGGLDRAVYGPQAQARGYAPTIWYPDESVPLSSANLRQLLGRLPSGGLF